MASAKTARLPSRREAKTTPEDIAAFIERTEVRRLFLQWASGHRERFSHTVLSSLEGSARCSLQGECAGEIGMPQVPIWNPKRSLPSKFEEQGIEPEAQGRPELTI